MTTSPPTHTQSSEAPRLGPQLAVVVPVFRARDDIRNLVTRLHDALGDNDYQIMFVDDNSQDGTVEAIEEIGAADPRVRVIRRVGRSGLTQTSIAAMLASGAPYVALLDPRAPWDQGLLAVLFQHVRKGADLAVAARPTVIRGLRGSVRKTLAAATRFILSANVTDPASGSFAIQRAALENLTPSLSSLGYQVLLDLIATARGKLHIVEVPAPHSAAATQRSELKLALELIALLLAKFSRDAVSMRFLLFCLVGLSGVGAHLASLYVALIALPFTSAQTVATICAIGWNFTLNNIVTYGDQRLTGWSYVTGMLRFMIVCGVGAVSNVGVASWIYAHDNLWWIAGLGGAAMGAVWNYAVSSVLVWRPR